MMETPRGYLQIVNTQLEDSGEYTCVAEDENNCRSERSATLTIINIAAHSDCKTRAYFFLFLTRKQ